MEFIKKRIKSNKSTSICYSLKNFDFQEQTNTLGWESFNFYTPAGPLIDDQGCRYFEVPAHRFQINRNATFDIYLTVYISIPGGIEIERVLAGAEQAGRIFSNEGDLVLCGVIPSNPNQEITIHYMEVFDENE